MDIILRYRYHYLSRLFRGRCRDPLVVSYEDWYAVASKDELDNIRQLYAAMCASTNNITSEERIKTCVASTPCGRLLMQIVHRLRWTLISVNTRDFEVLCSCLRRRLLTDCIQKEFEDEERKTLAIQFKSLLQPTHLKWTVPSFVRKQCALVKFTANFSSNSNITELHKTAPDHIDNNRDVGRGWCERMATVQLIREHMARMEPGVLYAFSDLLVDMCTRQNKDWSKNVDFICLLSNAAMALSARVNSQLIDITAKGCTCTVKCFGRVGHKPELETLSRFGFTNGSTIRVCGLCRKSTKQGGKKCLNGICPSVESCSACACSLFEYVQLCTLDYTETAYKHAHRFYTENSMKTIHGVCAGDRTCKQMIKKTNNKLISDRPSFNNIAMWFICSACKETRSEPKEDCLSQYVTGQFNDPAEICCGCRLAARCRHVELNLISRMQRGGSSTTTAYREMSRLVRVNDIE